MYKQLSDLTHLQSADIAEPFTRILWAKLLVTVTGSTVEDDGSLTVHGWYYSNDFDWTESVINNLIIHESMRGDCKADQYGNGCNCNGCIFPAGYSYEEPCEWDSFPRIEVSIRNFSCPTSWAQPNTRLMVNAVIGERDADTHITLLTAVVNNAFGTV